MSKQINNKFGVYGLFLGDTCIYVGRGELGDRRTFHRSLLQHHKHPNTGLQDIYDQYGQDAIEFRVLEYCLQSDYQVREQYFIDLYQPSCNHAKASAYTRLINIFSKQKSRAHKSAINSGERNPNAKLAFDDVLEIKRLADGGVAMADLAERFKVSVGHIRNILAGRKWISVSNVA